MEVLTSGGKLSIKDFIENLEYGRNHLINAENALIKVVLDRISILNSSLGEEVFRLKEIKDQDLLSFYELTKGQKLYSVDSTLFEKKPPVLSEDSYNMNHFMGKSFTTKSKVLIDLDPSLYAYAKKLAIQRKMDFRIIEGNAYFICESKKIPISKQIEDAFYKDEDSISFDCRDYNAPTIRCYVSSLSISSGRSIKCRVKDGVITVFFKEDEPYFVSRRWFDEPLSKFNDPYDAIEMLKSIILEYRNKYNINPDIKDDYDEDEF